MLILRWRLELVKSVWVWGAGVQQYLTCYGYGLAGIFQGAYISRISRKGPSSLTFEILKFKGRLVPLLGRF